MILLHKKCLGKPKIPVLINEHHILQIEPCGGKNDGSYISILDSPISIEVSENMVEISKAIGIKPLVICGEIERYLNSRSAEPKSVEYDEFPF